MIEVEAVLDMEGIIASVSVQGHAESGVAGESLLCAAVSILLRTAYETLSLADGVDIAGKAEKPGDFVFSVRSIDKDFTSWARGVTDSLLTGLSSLDREYPGELVILIRKNRRTYHGT